MRNRAPPFDLEPKSQPRSRRAAGKRRTEGDVELERQARDRSVGIQESNRIARGVDRRLRHEERAVHADGAPTTEDPGERVVNHLAVGIVVDFGLQRNGSSADKHARLANERTPSPS